MMDDLHNNIYVRHGMTKISICQHWDTPSDRINGTAAMQEVGIIPDDDDWGSMHIKKYYASLDSLIEVLEGIRDEIDQKKYSQSSCQGDARTAQASASSAT